MTCGIYSIKNKITGQLYIGQSVNIERRWKEHITKKKDKSYIDRAINKYGKDNFIFSIIEEVEKEKLNDREFFWLNKYKTYTNIKHYNLTKGGDTNPMDNPKSRQRISKKLKNRIRTRKHKLGLANSLNSTGFLHVTKDYNDFFKQGFRWVYRCKHNNKTVTLTSTSIKALRKKVLNKGLEWKVLNLDNVKKSISEEQKILGNKKNTSGYYHVSKNKCDGCKQGFIWVYTYKDGDKKKEIKRVNIDSLKEEVLNRGLLWERV